MGFREIFAICIFTFKQVWYSIKAKTIYAHRAPIIYYFENFLLYRRIVVVQIGLVIEKPVPVVLLGNGIPAPVGCFKILENDANVFVLFRIIGPNIIIPFNSSAWGSPCTLKPWVLI